MKAYRRDFLKASTAASLTGRVFAQVKDNSLAVKPEAVMNAPTLKKNYSNS